MPTFVVAVRLVRWFRGKVLKSSSPAGMTFVVSTGRTGSTFLIRALSRHPEIKIVRTRAGFKKEPLRYVRWKHRSFRSNRWRRHLPLGPYYRWRFWLSRASRALDQRSCVEINSYLFPFVSEVRSLFPKARMIHLIRDLRTFLPSALNRGWGMRRDRDRLKAPDLGESSIEQWRAQSPIQRLTWYWLRCNVLILQSQPEMTIRSEDVFGPGHGGYFELLGGLGVKSGTLPNFDQRANQTRFHYFPGWEEWKPAWRAEALSVISDAGLPAEITRLYPDLAH